MTPKKLNRIVTIHAVLRQSVYNDRMTHLCDLAPLGNTAPKKHRRCGEQLATVCPIGATWGSNPRFPAPIAMSLAATPTKRSLQKHLYVTQTYI